MSLRGYDAWLEAPYQRLYASPPRDVEDLLGERVWIEEEDAWGEIESWEEWGDADEDGRHAGVDLVVRVNGRTLNMSPSEIEEALAARPEGER